MISQLIDNKPAEFAYRDPFLKHLFARQPTSVGRRHRIDENYYVLGGQKLMQNKEEIPAIVLTMDHGRALAIFLSLAKKTEGKIWLKKFDIGTFCRLFRHFNPMASDHLAKAAFVDIHNCLLRTFHGSADDISDSSIVADAILNRTPGCSDSQKWVLTDDIEIISLRIADKLFEFINGAARSKNMNLFTWARLPDPLIQAIYAFAAPEVLNGLEPEPSEITLDDLFEELIILSDISHRDSAWNCFLKNIPEIIQRLNRTALAAGKLRLELRQHKRTYQFRLTMWMEGGPLKK